MKAIVIDGYGGVDQLHLRELPDPRPLAEACYMEGTRAGNGLVQVPGVSELQPTGYRERQRDRSASRTRSRFP
jgi:hypothetical protein